MSHNQVFFDLLTLALKGAKDFSDSDAMTALNASRLLFAPVIPPDHPARGFVLVSPDKMPVGDSIYPTLDELVCAVARFTMHHAEAGCYRDASMESKPLTWWADNLSVDEVPAIRSAHEAYVEYVESTLESNGGEGWIPMSFAEFCDSKECDAGMDYAGGIAREVEEWSKAGYVGVERGQLLMCDPSSIDTHWVKKPRVASKLVHTDGRVFYCTHHGVQPEHGAIPFRRFDEILLDGKTVSELVRDGALKGVASDERPDFSYNGCCMALRDCTAGELPFLTGQPGAGVVCETGLGDGTYPVYIREVETQSDGRRVAEARVVFLSSGGEDLDEDDSCGATHAFKDYPNAVFTPEQVASIKMPPPPWSECRPGTIVVTEGLLSWMKLSNGDWTSSQGVKFAAPVIGTQSCAAIIPAPPAEPSRPPVPDEAYPPALVQLAEQTGTSTEEWEQIDGPTTGVGIEYWFRHKSGNEAYACDDQGDIRIDLNKKDDENYLSHDEPLDDDAACFVQWDTGMIEEFGSLDAAESDMDGAWGRGLSGRLYTDADELVSLLASSADVVAARASETDFSNTDAWEFVQDALAVWRITSESGAAGVLKCVREGRHPLLFSMLIRIPKNKRVTLGSYGISSLKALLMKLNAQPEEAR